MFFHEWEEILRILVVGPLAYAALVLLLRVSGKRTLSKMNAFDLVVSVALGSLLATILLSEDVSLAEGVAAFLMLVLLQFVLAWLSVRSRAVSDLVKAKPTLLFFRGQFLRDAMRRERMLEIEVEAAVRAQGICSLEDVEAVVLETDGSITALKPPQTQSRQGAHSALQNVINFPPSSGSGS